MNVNEKYIQDFIKDIPFESPNPTHRDMLKMQLLNAFPSHRLLPAPHPVRVWGIKMSQLIMKVAAAAIILAAVLVGIRHLYCPTPYFHQIIEPLVEAHTITCTLQLEKEGKPSHTFEGKFIDPVQAWQSQSEGITILSDDKQCKIATLLPTQEKALIVNLQNLSKNENLKWLNVFHQIRTHLYEAHTTQTTDVEFLGKGKVNGRSIIGYHVDKQGLVANVWADAKTARPIRIEVLYDTGTIFITNLVFNNTIDKNSFNINIPAGYAVTTLEKDFCDLKGNVIDSLRLWADTTDIKPPSPLNEENRQELGPSEKEKAIVDIEKNLKLSYQKFETVFKVSNNEDPFTQTQSSTAPKDDLDVTIDVRYLSAYLWRGFDVYGPGNHSAVQSRLDAHFGKTGLGSEVFWSRAVGSGYENSEEIDATLYYAKSLFKDKTCMTNSKIGWTYYGYPDEPRSGNIGSRADMQELYADFTWPKICPIGIVPSYTMVCMWPSERNSALNANGGWLHILDLVYDLNMSKIVSELEDHTLRLSTELVYNDGVGAAYAANGSVDHDWSHFTVGLSTDFKLGNNLTLTPAIYHQISMDKSVNPDDETWFGLSLKHTF